MAMKAAKQSLCALFRLDSLSCNAMCRPQPHTPHTWLPLVAYPYGLSTAAAPTHPPDRLPSITTCHYTVID